MIELLHTFFSSSNAYWYSFNVFGFPAAAKLRRGILVSLEEREESIARTKSKVMVTFL